MSASFAWSVYNGKIVPHCPVLPKLTIVKGENCYMSWAENLDCGDAPLSFLDNTVALKQLEKAHRVSDSAELNSQSLNDRKSGVKR